MEPVDRLPEVQENLSGSPRNQSEVPIATKIPAHVGTTTDKLSKANQAPIAGTQVRKRAYMLESAPKFVRALAAVFIGIPALFTLVPAVFIIYVALLLVIFPLRVLGNPISKLLPEQVNHACKWLVLSPLNTLAYLCERTISFVWADLLFGEEGSKDIEGLTGLRSLIRDHHFTWEKPREFRFEERYNLIVALKNLSESRPLSTKAITVQTSSPISVKQEASAAVSGNKKTITGAPLPKAQTPQTQSLSSPKLGRGFEQLKNINVALKKQNLHINISKDGGATLSKSATESSEDAIRSLNQEQILSLINESIRNEFYDLANNLLTLNWKPAKTCLAIESKKLLKLVKRHGFNSNIKDLINSNRDIDPTCPSVTFDVDNDITIYKELCKFGYQADVAVLKRVLFHHGYPFLNVILEKSNMEWLNDNAMGILDVIQQTEAPLSIQLILNHFPTIGSHCSLERLKQAIHSRKQDFVDMVLNNGLELTKKQFEDERLFDLALETGNLKLIQDLCSYADRLGIPHPSYLEKLGLSEENSEEALREKLFHYAMFSPLSKIYQLAQTYPHLYPILPWVTERISLLVRFPSLDQAKEVNANYSDDATYLQSSQEYAEANLNFLNTVLPELTKTSRDEFLTKITSNRINRMQVKNKAYITRQVDKPEIMSTPFFQQETVPLIHGGILVSTRTYRYDWSHRHLDKLLFDNANKCWTKHPYIKNEGSHKIFTYFHPEIASEKSITLLYTDKWQHPPGGTFQPWLHHLQKLHKEILDYHLDLTIPNNKNLFFEKVTRAYWLMSTLCEMHRGTPHNVMIWLNAIYRHHKLPYPIPNRNSFFLDNTMLMSPFDEAIKGWHTFLEPTLDQALTFPSDVEKIKYFRELLKKHPQLTILCSPEFRRMCS